MLIFNYVLIFILNLSFAIFFLGPSSFNLDPSPSPFKLNMRSIWGPFLSFWSPSSRPKIGQIQRLQAQVPHQLASSAGPGKGLPSLAAQRALWSAWPIHVHCDTSEPCKSCTRGPYDLICTSSPRGQVTSSNPAITVHIITHAAPSLSPVQDQRTT